MKNVTRYVMVLGAGLAVTATLGVAPAQAAGSVAPAPAMVQPRDHDDDDDDVVGHYRTRRVCELVGRIGERRDRWEDYDCDRVRRGEDRGLWRLTVERDHDWWDDDDRDHDDDRRDRHRGRD